MVAVDPSATHGANGTVQPAADADRHRILYGWNETHAEFPRVCAHELFEAQAARDPTAIAVTFGDQALTYRQLNERANQVAHYLRRRGVEPDSLVGVSMYRTPLMVIALLGVWKSGAAYVPLDPIYPADRLAFMVDDAAVHVLLTEASAQALYPGAGGRLVCLDTGWPEIEAESRDNPASAATPANLAYVIYTSGSTGKPKGALIEHRGLVNYLCWAIRAYGVKAGDSAPVHSSISFDLTVTSLYPLLLAGGRVELLPDDVGAQSLVASLRRGARHALVKITPAHLELLTQQVSAREAAAMARVFVIGGENLTAEGLRFWREAAPATRLINEYGPTETVVGCCVYEVRPGDPEHGSIPIGRPIANTELYVLDESLQPVPVGDTGELYIGGAGVARGYRNRPELTRERFIADPFSGRPGARLYKTGDLARYRADGILEYLGRTDNQVKVRGYRIELGEIEATLAAHPQVRSCTVLLREDVPGNKQLVGYVVPQTGVAPPSDELRRFLLERLPDYMVPSHFVALEDFPLTQNGKIDRKALPVPSYQSASAGHEYVAPRTETEQRLADIWGELLKLERIGVHDDIFDLGASSLMVVAAVARVQSVFGAGLELQAVFENPTIAQIAAALGQTSAARAAGEAPRVPAAAATPVVAHADASAAPVSARALPRASPSQVLPIRFGTASREVVGLYQPPSAAADRRMFCVLCNPFGQEAVRAHRVFRTLADRLAHSGIHVLRFDYFGTGDSPGDDTEGELDGWIEDVLSAHEEVARRSGAAHGAWIGLRLGATLAALASAQLRRDTVRLALWDPVTDGAAYLGALAAAHIADRKAALDVRWVAEPSWRPRILAEAENEALGYPLTPTLKAQLRRLSLESFRGISARQITLCAAGGRAELAQLEQQLAGAGVGVGVTMLQSRVDWQNNEMLNDSMIGPDDMRALVGALTGDA